MILKFLLNKPNDMDDIYENFEEYNLNKERKILIIFNGMTADIFSNKKHQQIVTALFIWGRKLNISFVFITQTCFGKPKSIRLKSTYYSIMKISNKKELQQIAFNHSSDSDFEDFTNICKKSTAKTKSFLMNDTTLASDNLRNNLLEGI